MLTSPQSSGSTFASRVESIVRQIPAGRVMTYGQLAALAGSPQAARVVGGIAHYGEPELPWHRVVNRRGGLASGYPGGRNSHAEHLQAENVVVDTSDDSYLIDLNVYLWIPSIVAGAN